MTKHYRDRGWLTTTEARHIAGVCSVTIVRWVQRNGIGYQVGNRWRIDRRRLAALIDSPAATNAPTPTGGADHGPAA